MHGGERLTRTVTVQFHFCVEQHIGATRLRQHVARIHVSGIGQRHGTGYIAAYAVGSFAEETEIRADQLSKLVAQSMQSCRLWMMLCEIAEQNGSTLTRTQTLGDAF